MSTPGKIKNPAQTSLGAKNCAFTDPHLHQITRAYLDLLDTGKQAVDGAFFIELLAAPADPEDGLKLGTNPSTPKPAALPPEALDCGGSSTSLGERRTTQ